MRTTHHIYLRDGREIETRHAPVPLLVKGMLAKPPRFSAIIGPTTNVAVSPVPGLPGHWTEVGLTITPPRSGNIVILLNDIRDAITDHFYLPSLVRPNVFLVLCTTGWTWITRPNSALPTWTEANTYAN